MIVLAEDAALAVAYSPSGCAIFCMAVGAIIIGIDILNPKIVVVMSILLTSIRIRGLNLFYLTNKTPIHVPF